MTVTTDTVFSTQNPQSLIPTSSATAAPNSPKPSSSTKDDQGTLALAETPARPTRFAGSSTWNFPQVQTRQRNSAVSGLDKWEGKIVEVDVDTFTAELYPIDRRGMPITADFNLALLGSDAATAATGDVFYLFVRTVTSPGKRPTQTESLRLRRLGRITSEEVRSVYAKADALMEHLEQLFD